MIAQQRREESYTPLNQELVRNMKFFAHAVGWFSRFGV